MTRGGSLMDLSPLEAVAGLSELHPKVNFFHALVILKRSTATAFVLFL